MSGSTAPPAVRAKVRMYRHGLGDCLLVTLPRPGDRDYSILIDCGVLLGTADATATMASVVRDIATSTNGKIDLLLATHEHWDHVSGFIQAAEAFKGLDVGKVWMAWTEDPSDELGRKLAGERDEAITGLQLSAARLQLAGDAENAAAVGSLLGFFGAAPGRSTKDALEAVRTMGPEEPRYCKPGDAPVVPQGVRARLYVLGPPRDEKLIKRTSPGKRNPETYGLSLALGAFRNYLAPAFEPQGMATPFSTLFAIPNHFAQEMDAFKPYWSGEPWRRIDAAWLGGTTELALQLDASTNNTSLVLAIELDGPNGEPDGDVLLFAADAQVGNWLSWQDLSWTVGNRTITGPDLLRRTILYKVGHHGSHNATLKEKGLEQMEGLHLAMIPVFKEMAMQKRWGQMPLPELVDTLTERTGATNGVVLRSDEKAPVTHTDRVRVIDDPLFFEVEL